MRAREETFSRFPLSLLERVHFLSSRESGKRRGLSKRPPRRGGQKAVKTTAEAADAGAAANRRLTWK